MTDAEFSRLLDFYRTVVVPDIERIVGSHVEPLRNEMLSGFDAVYKRFDIYDSELPLVMGAIRDLEKQVAGVKDRLASIEGRLTHIEEKLDRFALRSEVAELKEQLQVIQQRITEIESLLNEH